LREKPPWGKSLGAAFFVFFVFFVVNSEDAKGRGEERRGEERRGGSGETEKNMPDEAVGGACQSGGDGGAGG
jgi:hypothetical protein